MVETSARLLRVLSLFQQRRYWSGADLADKLDVTTRTVRRDVDKLRSLGYPIHSAAGTEGGYQLGAGAEMPPLLLDDDEAVAVSMGLHAAATGRIAGIQEASVRALAKIEQLLPARLGRRLRALQSSIVTSNGADGRVEAQTLSQLASACRDCDSVRFRYRDQSATESHRWVEPCRLVYTGYRWYLVAWEQNRNDWRTFRLDRIASKVLAGPRFEPRDPPAEDLAAYVSSRAGQAPRCRASVKLLTPAEALSRNLPAWIGTLEPLDTQSCLLHMAGDTYEALAVHATMLGVDFEATAPAEFLEEIDKLSNRLQRACPADQRRGPVRRDAGQ